MEQHPVPQNVTTFQFRLVGDMTLKQFGYLAAGALLAYICYKLPLPLLLNWGLAIVAGLSGFGFAFVPIEERPMDVWVLSFFKSIYSPTIYTWSKPTPAPPASPVPHAPAPKPVPQIHPPTISTSKGDILQNIFQPQTQGAVLTQTQKKSGGPLDWLFDMLMPRPKPHTIPVVHPPTPIPEVHRPVVQKTDFTPPPTVRPRVETPKVQPLAPEPAFPRIQSAPPVPKPTGTYIATPAAKAGPSVRIITPDRAVKAGLPRLTTFANVVTGIVKDGDQNLLPGVLITVKDKEGVPVRALKTNRLGQFAASTPLTNGTYLLEIEDPRLRYTFDRAQVTLNGSVVPALEIFAKSQKEITRAKLEKELFGKQN